MKKLRPFLLFTLILLSLLFSVVALWARQDAPRLEITGINPAQMPLVTITANVFDNLSQPMRGLVKEDFALLGELAGQAEITNVENISDENLPFAAVLVIDVSSSMADLPLINAKAAARAFVESLGAEDQVAILAFGSDVRMVQDYTSNRATLIAAIEGLQARGETALYQGAYDGVLLTSSIQNPRRAMILLSDGAEYGGESDVGRGAALQEALLRGVPIYTIGTGYGFDRTYLQELSEGTNARFYESPNAEQLTQIYTDLAALLRSQYVITLDAPLPLDGTEYDLELQVTTAQGIAQASAILRAPIPVPIVDLAPIDEAISVLTEITPTIRADDPITSVLFSVEDREPVEVTAAPYSFSIDPVTYLPGEYLLTAAATDADGSVGSALLSFTVAALPSQIRLSPEPDSLGPIDEPQTITVITEGQTPTTAVVVDFGGTPATLTEPYSFDIQPLQFIPGENTVTVSVTNAGGITSSEEFSFRIAAVPPLVRIAGLEDGQSIDVPTEFSVSIVSQEIIASSTVTVGSLELERSGDNTYILDPMLIEPGAVTLHAEATDGVRIGADEVNLLIAALPPQIIVDGLTEGETLEADRQLSFNFVSQTPVIHVGVFVDDEELAHLVQAPFGINLNVLDFAPGEHNLRLIADNASSQQSTLEIPFSIAPGPAATATRAVADILTITAEAQIAGTQIALASETAAAQMVIDATATQVAQLGAQASATQLILNATAIVDQATLDARATVTDAAQMTATQRAQATLDVQATETDAARATVLANELATLNAQLTATQVAGEATASREAISEATANAQVTQVAAETATAQATMRAAVAQQAQLATRDALATANAQARVDAEATQNARATRNAAATATESAEQTATALRASDDAIMAFATQVVANATATAQQATQAAQATQDALDATATQLQLTTAMQATRDQVATVNALVAATVTEQRLVLDTTATAEAAVLATDIAGQTATVVAQETLNTRLTAVGPTATPLDGGAQAAGTPGATPTLAEVQTGEPPGTNNLVPILIVIIVIVVIIIVVLLMRRPSPPRR